jgi:hypothetical protein
MLLTNDGYSVEFVGSRQSGNGIIPSPNDEGHPGWTILQIKNGIDSNGWLESYQSDIVLLHIGTNDLNKGEAAAPINLSALLDDILARLPPAHVIVAQIIPFGPVPTGAISSITVRFPASSRPKAPGFPWSTCRIYSPQAIMHRASIPMLAATIKMARALRAVIPGSAQRDEIPAPRGALAVAAVRR